MGFQNIWYSHPRKYGQGSRSWWVYVLIFFNVNLILKYTVHIENFIHVLPYNF